MKYIRMTFWLTPAQKVKITKEAKRLSKEGKYKVSISEIIRRKI